MNVFEYENELYSLLEFEFKKRVKLNPQYSLRAFSRFLEVSPSTISQIFTRKRGISHRMKKKIEKKLRSTKHKYEDLNVEEFEILSYWYFDAVLESLKIKGFRATPHWVSSKLKIEKEDAQFVLKFLKNQKMILKDKEGKWKDGTSGHTSTLIPNRTSEARKNYQESILSASLDSLRSEGVKRRSHSGMTVSIKRKNMEKAKELIDEFRKKFARIIDEDANAEEVYQLSVSFFPLTKD